MRLVWVPPMKPGGYSLVGEKKWERFDPDQLDNVIYGSDGEGQTWRSYLEENDQHSLLDVDEGNAVWEQATTVDSTVNDMVLTSIEKSIPRIWNEDIATAVAMKEKILFLQEDVQVDTEVTTSLTLTTTRRTFTRPVHTIPLLSSETQVGGSDMLSDYAASSPEGTVRVFDRNSDPSQKPRTPLAQLKIEIMKSEDYKFLFDYIFPLPRMLSLVTIYTANSMSISNPRVGKGFDSTKEALRSLFYILSPEEGKQWYEREDIKIKQEGGSVGSVQAAQSGGLGPMILQMIIDTVPILIRHTAEQLDPHYGQVSRLVDAGVWPLPKNFASVPPLWPANFLGWGPPLTPLGAIAYGLPETSRDKKKNRDNAIASGVTEDSCEEVEDDDELDDL